MSAAELAALVCCDLGGIVRGRSLFASELGRKLDVGVSWVPANHSLTPTGGLAEPNPFGPLGDLRLLPDRTTRVRLKAQGPDSALELMLCDIVQTDGTPWECCPRRFLREALELLGGAGIRVMASFEHEFQLLAPDAPALPFSLEAQRRAEPFAAEAMGALVEAGVQPERFFAEYAPHQFEVPVAPAPGMAGADRSVVLKEVVREIARRRGLRVSFAPLLDPDTAGNGVHIHVSLLDDADQPLLHDPSRPGRLSELGGRFAAGILRHAGALSALTAPSPASAARLQPHRWSAGAVCLGLRNRETLLRIPPLVTLGGTEPGGQMHLEYRGADAAANPYLALGAILRAGLAGIDERLPAPEILERDPASLDETEARRFGVGAWPATLEDSLAALAGDETARGWLDPLLYDAYTGVKRAEIEATAGLDAGEVCRRYGEIY
ncbi:MAG TPA: glutamine synthetase family protein [Solirubrobacteraceae bacterium]|nr:glutamine synthetase family protein [Solirubrobacteraceae bacterium]